MRFAEPVQQHAVFGDTVQHPVDADQRSVDGAGENHHAHDHDEDMEHQFQHRRPGKIHHQAGDHVVVKLGTRGIGNDHYRKERNHARTDQRIGADDVRRNAEVLELRVGDLTVNLRQGLKAAHREK